MKLQTEYGDAIQVILVESQGASDEMSLSFALRNKWLGNNAIWTTERPFSTGGSGLPSYALLGPDGKVLMVGNSASDHSKINQTIAELVKKGSSAPAEAPEALTKAYKQMDEGNYAKAIAEARKVGAKAQGKDAVVAEAATKFEAQVAEKVGREAARVRALTERGQWIAADARHESLLKGVKGEDSLIEKTSELVSLFEGPEVQKEMMAEKELLRLSADAYEAGKDEKAVKKLQKFATDHAGTKIGERARRIADLAQAAISVR
ncbi:MAG: hypothetical protein O3A20_01010 [Planctomycetota bacterium]|nr:hypothetical protein [Planctomycetota bacterium]